MKQRKKKKGRIKRLKPESRILLLTLLVLIGCGSKMPPPGKPDLDPPRINITYPEAFDTVKGVVYIRYTCEDKSPIDWIKLYVDGRITFTLSNLSDSIPFKSDSLYDEEHKLMLEAKDKWDNVGKSPIVQIITNNGNKKEEKKDEGMDREHKGIR